MIEEYENRFEHMHDWAIYLRDMLENNTIHNHRYEMSMIAIDHISVAWRECQMLDQLEIPL